MDFKINLYHKKNGGIDYLHSNLIALTDGKSYVIYLNSNYTGDFVKGNSLCPTRVYQNGYALSKEDAERVFNTVKKTLGCFADSLLFDKAQEYLCH